MMKGKKEAKRFCLLPLEGSHAKGKTLALKGPTVLKNELLNNSSLVLFSF